MVNLNYKMGEGNKKGPQKLFDRKRDVYKVLM